MSCVINKYLNLFKKNNIRCPCNNKATGIIYIKKYYNHNFLVCSVCLKHILLHVLVDNYIEL